MNGFATKEIELSNAWNWELARSLEKTRRLISKNGRNGLSVPGKIDLCKN
jgi:hypothetical protein